MQDQSVRGGAGAKWSRFLLGVLLAGLGVAIVLWPDRTLRAVALLVGAALLVSGVTRIIASLLTTGEASGARWVILLSGALAVVLGVFFVRNLTESLEVIVVLVGLLWILGGIIEMVAGVAAEAGERGWAILAGILSLVVGIVLVSWPDPTLTVFAVVAGIYLILAGLAEMVRAFRRPAMMPA